MTGNGLDRWWEDSVALAGFVALTLAFFWKLIFTNLVLAGLDIFTYFYPYREYAAELWRQGQLALWNPYLFMGVPFLANAQAAVLYPLNVVLAWLPVTDLVKVSIGLHVLMAAVFTYVFVRRSLGMSAFSAFLAATCFALGGFIGAQVEHINQLNVTVWLPLLLFLMEGVWGGVDKGRRIGAGLAAGMVVALQILAGHTQAVYITSSAVGLYGIGRWVVTHFAGTQRPSWWEEGRLLAAQLAVFAGVVLLGSLLAAAQLLPALELSTLSYRSGGLPYRDAVSFSLRPHLLLQSLLPPYGIDLGQVFGESFSEYVVYIGVLGLVLAGIGALWGRRPQRHVFTLLAAVGLFLALGLFNPVYYLLYRTVPGFSLFRAPVRWMLLYSFGASILVGYGCEALLASGSRERLQAVARRIRDRFTMHRRTRAITGLALGLAGAAIVYFLDLPGPLPLIVWGGLLMLSLGLVAALITRAAPRYVLQAAVAVVLLAELYLGSRCLAYNKPTAPQAYYFLRTAPAFLMTDRGLHRFISMSTMPYDPGDLQQLRDLYGPYLPEAAVYDVVVSAKRKEVLAFNLPLHYRLYAVDGYDGGLLPLQRFVELQRLFVSEEDVSPDGRLREKLQDVPSSRLLSLLNVKYVVTDKVYDVWIDDVFYDLQFTARLSRAGVSEVSTDDVPEYQATAIGVISYLQGGAELTDGTPVAEVVVRDDRGNENRFVLHAGEETAEGEYGIAGPVRHDQARVGHHWRDNPGGNDYVATFDFPQPTIVDALTVRSLTPSGEFHLRGLSLIDRRTSSSRTVLLSTSGRFRLVHSGDVKIYENVDNLPRAYVVHSARVIPDDGVAIAAMRERTFRPADTVILAQEPARLVGGARGTDRVEIVRYAPEHIVIRTETEDDGYLVLSDSYYPGWQAWLDGSPVPVYRANVIARAVDLPAGRHEIEFRYRPRSFHLGMAVSVSAVLLVTVGFLSAVLNRREKACK